MKQTTSANSDSWPTCVWSQLCAAGVFVNVLLHLFSVFSKCCEFHQVGKLVLHLHVFWPVCVFIFASFFFNCTSFLLMEVFGPL